MRNWVMFLLLLAAFAAAPLHAEEAATEDELTTTEEETLVGKFIKIDAGKVYFESATIGLQKIDVEDVVGIKLAKERKLVKSVEKNGKTSYDGVSVAEIKPKDYGYLADAAPDTRADWFAGVRLAFSWTEGNTKTYAFDARFDIVRTTKHDFATLFGEANYLQDREREENPVLERNFLLGAAYRYIFDFNLTIDATQDFYFNELAGYHYRSVTGVGPGYYFWRKPDLTAHAGAHLVYVYEDQMFGAEDRGYIGARIRAELDTVQLDGDLHLNFRTEVIFDFDETKNTLWNNRLLVTYQLSENFDAGIEIRHFFDNLPPPGFFHHDFEFLFTLGFSWGGKWY